MSSHISINAVYNFSIETLQSVPYTGPHAGSFEEAVDAALRHKVKVTIFDRDTRKIKAVIEPQLTASIEFPSHQDGTDNDGI